VQTKDDGKHAILPAAERSDRARVPVMMPRDSDGKMRRGGSKAARTQHPHPVDERGRVHGVPELSAKADKSVAGKISVVLNTGKEKRRWGTRRAKQPRLRGQDKSRKVRGGRTDEETNKYSLLVQGARKPLTFLKSASHCECCDPCTLEVSAP
jgi:hypothetical protein